MNQPFISIIIPCYNEANYILSVLEALINQTYPADKMEIFAVDGKSTDQTRDIISTFSQSHSVVKLLDNPGRTAPKALNIGIKNAKGEIIIRIDAHCHYPQNYIETLVFYLYKLNADNVGAPFKTLPANNSLEAEAVAAGMSHKFGVGNSKYRVGAKGNIAVDTVPYGCYRSQVFKNIGVFDEDLTRNQDEEFNARLMKNGGKIFLINEIKIDYFARDKITKAARMFFQYGLFKPLVNKKLMRQVSLRQFVPPIFVLAWLACIIWLFVAPFFKFLPLLLLACFYFITALYFGLQIAMRRRRMALALYMPMVFFTFHTAYGLGYLKGFYLFMLLNRKTVKADSNR